MLYLEQKFIFAMAGYAARESHLALNLKPDMQALLHPGFHCDLKTKNVIADDLPFRFYCENLHDCPVQRWKTIFGLSLAKLLSLETIMSIAL